MLQLDNRRSKKIDSVFVIALFTMFAITAFLLILIGAKQYRHTADSMDENYEIRTVNSYLMEKIRQNDSGAGVCISDVEGIPALTLKTCEEDITYITYIYYHKNALREIVVTESSVFSLDSGQEIMPIGDFKAELEDSDLLKITVTTTDGQEHTLYLHIHSNAGKEQT